MSFYKLGFGQNRDVHNVIENLRSDDPIVKILKQSQETKNAKIQLYKRDWKRLIDRLENDTSWVKGVSESDIPEVLDDLRTLYSVFIENEYGDDVVDDLAGELQLRIHLVNNKYRAENLEKAFYGVDREKAVRLVLTYPYA